MNEEDEVIRKSFNQIKYFLNLNDYIIPGELTNDKITKIKMNHNKMNYDSNNSIQVKYKDPKLESMMPKIYLYYWYDNISKTNIDKLIGELSLTTQDTLIIITKDYASTIHELLSSKHTMFYINIFKLRELQYNILEHAWVPKHIKLKESEKEELFHKYNISKDNQLPQISRFDPAAKAILLRPGEVCKIIRHDKISLTNEFYRICVG
jgi:DNA-directed RNA polymerase subunit H (RpoH/RPB5)